MAKIKVELTKNGEKIGFLEIDEEFYNIGGGSGGTYWGHEAGIEKGEPWERVKKVLNHLGGVEKWI